jgi:hypothetical protein
LTLSSDHRASAGILLTDLALNTPSLVATQNSPLRARTPTKMPKSHLELILSIFALAFFFQSSFSPNSMPKTVADLPLTLSYAVLPSFPTSSLLTR